MNPKQTTNEKIPGAVIVSIDWDYVTGSCYQNNCQNNCCGFCDLFCSGFGRGNIDLLYFDWVKRYRSLQEIEVRSGTPIYVAECHANIQEVFMQTGHPFVYDFDAHFDRYNNEDMINCSNWIYHLEQHGGKVVNVHRTHIEMSEIRPDLIFLCRSAPWTPAELDKDFYRLIHAFAIKSRVNPIFIGHERIPIERDYRRTINESRQQNAQLSL